MRKIGVLGGTFDPVHKAHILICEEAKKVFDLDEIFLVPAYEPPHKNDIWASFEDRVEMLKLAVEDKQGISVLDIEKDLPVPSYAYNTFHRLKELYPSDRLYYINGSDSVASLATWGSPHELIQECEFLVKIRKGFSKKETLDILSKDFSKEELEKFFFFKEEKYDFSSTQIREKIIFRESLEDLVEDRVLGYIKEKDLYSLKMGQPLKSMDYGRFAKSFVDKKRWDNHFKTMEKLLKPSRLEHSLAVADTAVLMGKRYGGDLSRLAVAGLLHDGAKYFKEKLLEVAEREGLITDEMEYRNPDILHGPVASWYCENVWHESDPVLVEAVRYHTTGYPGISKEAAIVFMADLIEPHRDYPNVEKLREFCLTKSLEESVLLAIEETIIYLERDKREIHQSMLLMKDWLVEEKGVFHEQ